MIDLTPVDKQAAYWPMLEMVKEIESLKEMIVLQEQKITDLEEKKADRRGRKRVQGN